MAAAIFAAEADHGRGLRIVLIEGAKKPGAKILVSGGGRCNVTNQSVSEKDFWGGSRAVIRNVLREFDETRTLAWFEAMGVRLKCEPTGKYFPVTNQARTVLDALLHRLEVLGVSLWTGSRVSGLTPSADGIEVVLADGQRVRARKVIIATGGLALPKSGSDGLGLSLMQRLGHTIIPTTPALTPLVLKTSRLLGGRFAEFAGVSMEARLRLERGPHRKVVIELTGSLLFTHFGLSGPVAMDLSRHWLRERLLYPKEPLTVAVGIPRFARVEESDRWLLDQCNVYPRRLLSRTLSELLPVRLAMAVAQQGGPDIVSSQLDAKKRAIVASMLAEMPVEVTGTRDYSDAEATAGGVDLAEVDWRTMQSRRVPNLHLCGEILDVDGRIGGYNFQWAWASGHLAGRGASVALQQ